MKKSHRSAGLPAIPVRVNFKDPKLMAAAGAVLVLLVLLLILPGGRDEEPAELSPTPEISALPETADAETPAESVAEELRDAADLPPADLSQEIAGRAVARRDGFPLLSWRLEGFSLDADGRMRYADARTLTGIDVSEHQGEIDWAAVRADGIDFAMIRIGYRGSTAGGIYEDAYFEENIRGALQSGLRVGVYFYSQARNAAEAAEEAAWVLERLGDYSVTMPVVFDWEIVGGEEARTYTVTREALSEATRTFCDRIRAAGYEPMLYFTRYLGYRKYILRELGDIGFWYAEYEERPRTAFDFTMWQYSDTGRVAGIEGSVDLNIYFPE